jgi:hypothetical protein
MMETFAQGVRGALLAAKSNESRGFAKMGAIFPKGIYEPAAKRRQVGIAANQSSCRKRRYNLYIRWRKNLFQAA